jgi:hypothetical protein
MKDSGAGVLDPPKDAITYTVSGTDKAIVDIQLDVSSTLKKILTVHYNPGTGDELIYPTPVPSYVVIPYVAGTSLPPNSTIETSLYNYTPRAASTSFGTTGGFSTHSGHGAGRSNTSTTGTVSNSSYPGGFNAFGSNTFRYYTSSSHSHAVGWGTHTHTSSSGNLPSYTTMIPVSGGTYIGTDALILQATSSAADWNNFFTAWTTHYRLVVFSSTAVTNGIDQRGDHGNKTETVNYSSYNSTVKTGNGSSYPLQQHRHNNIHDHSHISSNWHSTAVYPYSNQLKPYNPSTDLNWNDLPQGSVVMSLTGTIPPGWSDLVTVDANMASDALLKLNSATTSTLGVSTHSHSHGAHTTGAPINKTTTRSGASGTSRRCPAPTHAGHSISSGGTNHSSTANLPPYVNVRFIVKD